MATYYWVGGSGTWSGTGNTQFAITSGGAPTALNPTNGDLVEFDANSGTAATVTVTATAVSTATTVNKSDINLSLSGSPTLTVLTGALTLTAGTITLNNNTLSVGRLASNNTNARAIAFGASGKILVYGNSFDQITFNKMNNFTYTGTSWVELSYSGSSGTRVAYFGNDSGATETNAMNVYLSAGGDTALILGVFKTFSTSGFTGILGNYTRTIYGNLIIGSGITTINAGGNTTTFAATSGTQQLTSNAKTLDFPITVNGVGTTVQLQDNLTVGSTRTFTLTNGTLDLNSKTLTVGLFNSTNTNTRVVAFGTGNITLTNNNATIWSTSTADNFSITGTPVVNATYSGATGTRTLSFGALSEANAITLNISAGTDSITLTPTGRFKDLNFTGFAGTLNNNAMNIYGNVTFSSGMTLAAGTGTMSLVSTSGTKTITTNAKTLDFPITFDGVGGTFAFQDALTQGSTRAFTITNGTVQLKAGVTSTVGSFVANSATMKYLQSTSSGSQATISQASGTVNASNLTIKDINATGGATWNAYYINGDINAGNNTGWDFLVQLGRYIYSRRKNKVILN